MASVRKARESHLLDKAMTLEPNGLSRCDESIVTHILITFSFPVFCVVRHFRFSFLNHFYCDVLHLYNISDSYHHYKFSNICKPEEGWCGQPKYCYEKTMHVVLI